MHVMMGLDHNLRSRTTVTTGLDHAMPLYYKLCLIIEWPNRVFNFLIKTTKYDYFRTTEVSEVISNSFRMSTNNNARGYEYYIIL